MFGFLNVRKPPGPTSHDMVYRVRRMAPRHEKVGHAGTLDPFAYGVLVVCLGPACRLAEYPQRLAKRYTAGVILGASSTTDDPEGDITPSPDAVPPDERQVRAVLSAMTGQIMQAPPGYSAININGQRAYALARKGQEVVLPPRPVTIYSIELLDYEYPHLRMDVRCASGTYIRALARDIGAALGIGAYCRRLSRTEIGPYLLKDALEPGQIDLRRDLLSPMTALAGLPHVRLDDTQAGKVLLGQKIALTESIAPLSEVVLLGPDGALVAIGQVLPDRPTIRPVKVFPPHNIT